MDIKIVNTVSIKEEILDLGIEEQETSWKTCQICGLQVESEELVKHVAHDHCQCFFCELTLGSKSAVWQHLLLVHKVKLFHEFSDLTQKSLKFLYE